MENNWIHEEMGEDVGAISGRDRSIDSLDMDTEGSGVDAPDLDSAAWDDEMEFEDREDFSAEHIKFDELTDEDRNIYLAMVSLRNEINDGTVEREGRKEVRDLIKRCEDIKADLMDGSRPAFLDLMIRKLKECIIWK